MADHKEILRDLKNKIFKPVYFLAGKEPYYIDILTDYIEENVLDENEKSFNQTVLYGLDTTVTQVIETCRRFPMMSNNQVVIVREAQKLKKIEDLQVYIETPLQSTILVVAYKYDDLDKRKALYKVLSKKGYYFESDKVPEYQIPGWIDRYLTDKGIMPGPDASRLLSEFLGNDLGKISNELEKLIISLPKDNPRIDTALIEKSIGISKEYTPNELWKAIVYRDPLKAARVVNFFAEHSKKEIIPIILPSLFSNFSRVLIYHNLKDRSDGNVVAALKTYPGYVKDYKAAATIYSVGRVMNAISLIRSYDLKVKGFGDTGSDTGDLLRELVFKIMH
jgi:DNA polymerase III subunit delta